MRISDWSSDVCSSDLAAAGCCRLATQIPNPPTPAATHLRPPPTEALTEGKSDETETLSAVAADRDPRRLRRWQWWARRFKPDQCRRGRAARVRLQQRRGIAGRHPTTVRDEQQRKSKQENVRPLSTSRWTTP